MGTVIDRQNNLTANLADSEPVRLPKRDLILLPLLSILTILAMFGVSEIVTRLIWPAQYSDACNIDDPVAGHRFKPNCTVRAKIAEGPWITYYYNECGYRSTTACGPKPSGKIRVAILGSSMSQALHVPYEDAFFSRAASELSRLCDRPVDVQNLGVPGSSPAYAFRHVREALALNPDLVLYLVVPYDLNQQILPKTVTERGDATLIPLPAPTHAPVGSLAWIERLLLQSRTMLVAEHFVFQNKDAFVRTYLMYGDKADYLRQPFAPAWQQRFADFDVVVGEMADELRASGVPLMIIAVPSRAEAALLSSPQQLPHVDPFAFGREMSRIAARHGAGYLDLMQPFSRIPNAENLYYVVDGHVTSEGHRVIAQQLLQKLQDGSVPAFSSCALRQNVARKQ